MTMVMRMVLSLSKFRLMFFLIFSIDFLDILFFIELDNNLLRLLMLLLFDHLVRRIGTEKEDQYRLKKSESCGHREDHPPAQFYLISLKRKL